MKKIIFILLLVASTGILHAYDFQVDGICYNILTGQTNAVEVTQSAPSHNYSGLTNAEIPNFVTYQGTTYSVTRIGEYAFSYCSSLTSVTIPNSVTSIGSTAFHLCSGLTSITIPSGVTTIGNVAFGYCSSLTSITCEATTPPILDNYAFTGVVSSIPLYVPGNSIALYQAANGWSAFTNIQAIQESAPEMPTGPFIVDSIYYQVISDQTNAVEVTRNSSSNIYSYLTTANIPDSVTYQGITYSVTSIGSYAFYGCNSLTSVTIPNSVTSIENGAFANCSVLTSIVVATNNPTYDSRDNCNAIIETAKNTLIVGCQGTTIPTSVTTIGKTAFQECRSMTSVTFPNNVISIRELAFWGCNSLTSVTIPNSVTTIENGAFANCSVLTSIVVATNNPTYDSRDNCNAIIETATNTLIVGCQGTIIPSSVTSIGEIAFQECSSMTSVTIPNSLMSIGKRAFWGCNSLTSITIPNSVTSIENGAFANCNVLTSMVVAANNPTYDSRDNCNAIIETASNTLIAGCQRTIIPNSVTSLGRAAFQECKGLTAITIPNSVTSIGDYVLYGCSGLTSITCNAARPPVLDTNALQSVDTTILLYVPAGSIARYQATEQWQDFTNIQAITCDTTFHSEVDMTISTADLPYVWHGHELTESGSVQDTLSSIDGCDSIVTLNLTVLPGGRCGDNLTWMYNPQDSSLTISGTGAMTDYTSQANVPWYVYHESISTLHLPEGLTTIGTWAFYECNKLADVSIPNSLTRIGWLAFYSCKSLTELTIPNSVTDISQNSFANCQSLVRIQVDTTNSVYSSADGVLFDKNQTQLICYPGGKQGDYSIPNSVTSIEDNAFYGCSGLTSVTIPNSVTSIGYRTFYKCTGLVGVTIPNSVTNIGTEVFSNCSSLAEVTIPNSVTGISNYAFCFCTGLIDVTIPNSVTSIGSYAFQGCSGLASVTIPDSVMSIGDWAFSSCNSLTELILSNGLISIGTSAFSGCENLTSLTCEATTPPTCENNVFSNVNTNQCVLYVPYRSVSAYQVADTWSAFANIQAIPCDTVYEFSETFNLCGADNFTWHDKVYTASGTYVDTLLSVEGCDSIVTLELNFLPTYLYADSITIYDGTRYYWRGRDLAEAGTYYDSLQSVSGCDSVYMLTLSIGKCVIEIDTTILVCYDELPYEHNGVQYWDRDSTFTDTLFSIDACDTIYRTKFVRTGKCNEYRYGKYCDNDYPVIGNDTIKTSCMYHQQVWTSSGLDSVFRYKIEINPTYEDSIPDTVYICQGDTFVWYYNDYTQSGLYSFPLLSQDGCDSIVKLELIVGQVYHFTETVSLCDGESYTWHGLNLTTSGIYYDSLVSSTGCDSIYQLNLIVHQSYYFEEDVSTCQGTAYLWHGRRYSVSGIYYDSLQTVSGCDSIYQLRLTVNPTYTISESDTICEGETYQWHGRTFKRTGTYYDFLKTINGCDSIYTLHLTVNPTYLIEDIVSVREDKLPYMWQGEAINQSGDYRKEYTATTGCDSVHTLHFTVTALPIYTVNVLADHGHVNGTGTYPEGTRITLTAVPDEGFEFQMWSDGTTTNPKNFTVLQDTTFRALFYMPEVEQEVTVDSIETNSVTITWDTVPGAVLYELSIYKNGQLVVTYQVDPDNNILNEIFNGPDRLIARKDSTGGSSETLQVEVSGLESGQDYTYSLDALDDDRSFVGAQSGTFTTEEEPIDGLDTLFDKRHSAEPRKILRDGLLFIELPDGRLYTPIGDELQ